MHNDNSKYDILIVDDSSNNILLLHDLLSELKYNVRTAQNGQEAYIKIIEKSPDLVLLDIMMPGMDGYETCKRLKADPETF